MRSLLTAALSFLLTAAATGTADAIALLQIDTFEDGTTQGWTVGTGMTPPIVSHPTPPANVASGGPAGAADNYLRLTAVGGIGPGSRLSALNRDQWAGDYAAAGVTKITMQVNNFGLAELSLRLLLMDATIGPPTNLAITDVEVVPAGSGWISIDFSLAVGDLVALLGTASAALTGATELRIFHNPAPEFGGPGVGPPPVTALLGVDNICAASANASCLVQPPAPSVPLPATVCLLAGGALASLFVGRMRRRG